MAMPWMTPGEPGVKANASLARKSGVVTGLPMKTGFCPASVSYSGWFPSTRVPVSTYWTLSSASIS